MLENGIFNIASPAQFDALALEIFRFQYKEVAVYQKFCRLMAIDPLQVDSIREIPFLPIQMFKTQKIISKGMQAETTFTSSGTTGQIVSKHHVARLKLYERSFLEGFEKEYGKPSQYTILALLPSYLERQGSSLVYMVNGLIESSQDPESGFYLNELDELSKKLQQLDTTGKKILLIGVSYALLDLIEKRNFQLKNTIVMETGGMKGRRKEMVKEELHHNLRHGFGVDKIHSEYGMTELLSQAYSKGEGVFFCPPWMRVYTRDPEEATRMVNERTGGINVIDLANIYSCSFIATQDLGRKINDKQFEIVGRFDDSDIRGCNLMVL